MNWNIELMLSSMFVYQDGWTSLMWAAKAGKVEVVKLLLDRGADMSAASNSNRLSRVNGNSFFYVKLCCIDDSKFRVT